ncbi:cytochrome P450 4A4-like [Engystomops pustulosus]|uniref:cytochrome P450 4A4-like n=1 Tax=Engystomops pustulosus TaxID=76066 RepID=UPI003AFA653B
MNLSDQCRLFLLLLTAPCSRAQVAPVMSPPVLYGLGVPDLWSWVLWLGLLYVLVKASKLYLTWRQLDKALRPFEGPKRHWLYGNAHEFSGNGKFLDTIAGYAEEYPYAFPIWLGNLFAWLIICHPEYAKAVLSRQDPKDNLGYYFITPWIGKGLLVLSGEKWFCHRRLLTPGFHYDVLKPYVTLMSDCVTIMLDKWERLIPDENPVELFHHVSLMTLDTIMKCAFSYQSNCQMDSESAYIKAVFDLSYLADYRFCCLPYHNDLIFHLSPHGYRFRRALRIAHEHTDKVIQERKQSLQDEMELEKIQKKRHLDFLDILLCAKDENGQGLSDEDLRAEVDTFMFEGHDTTASGISWIFYCLAKNPEHQEKCREEIREVLEGRNIVEWEDLGKVPYTTMCIKESMRLFPPVPGVARELKEPITFFDGRRLPKGVDVFISIYAINRCSSIWENPGVFDPLRFSPENTSNRHPHAFLPFSAGGRNCIGQNFAMNEMKVAVALTLQRYELHTVPGKEPLILFQIVLRSMNGIHLHLKRIDCAKKRKV